MLLIVEQLADVVGLVTWTCLLVPGAIVPTLHVRTPDVMLQFGASVPAPSIVQLRPAVVGRLSVIVTPVAVPAPDAFATVITNPIDVPALTQADTSAGTEITR